MLGAAEQVAEARVRRKRMGGGMRQVGMLAAAGLYALDHNIERLAEDHEHARLLAEACGIDPALTETNIVVVDVPDAPALVTAAREQGVLVGAVGPTRVRMLTHLDVDRAAVEQAAKVLSGLLEAGDPRSLPEDVWRSGARDISDAATRRHGGSWRTAWARARRSAPNSAWGPSQSAFSGSGCTSTMTPSAPTAIAARDRGTTRSRRPPACEGSTMIGRWLVACTTGTAEMSRVLRVLGSKVRMPRSQSTTSRLPRWATYSAAISHSSMVAVMPRLSSTGLPALADGLEQAEVGHVAGADLEHVGVLGDDRDVAGVDDLGDDRQAGDLADVGEDLEALHAEALEGVRRGARLVGAAAQQRGAGGLGHLGGLEGLLGRLDGARAGDEGERVRADRHLVARRGRRGRWSARGGAGG